MEIIENDNLNELKTLTSKKKYSCIEKNLNQLSVNQKGAVFEEYLEYLYQGNGWLTKRVGGKGDGGADILLFTHQEPEKVAFIIQAKNRKSPITYDETKLEINKFDEKSKLIYNCNNYKIVAINGYVENTKRLGKKYVSLESWDYIENLIDNFNSDYISPVGENPIPNIELTTHNRCASNSVLHHFDTSNRTAVIHATGTGKSYIACYTAIQFAYKYYPSKKIIFIAPSKIILERQHSKMPWCHHIEYFTYAKLINLPFDYWKNIDASLLMQVN